MIVGEMVLCSWMPPLVIFIAKWCLYFFGKIKKKKRGDYYLVFLSFNRLIDIVVWEMRWGIVVRAIPELGK